MACRPSLQVGLLVPNRCWEAIFSWRNYSRSSGSLKITSGTPNRERRQASMGVTTGRDQSGAAHLYNTQTIKRKVLMAKNKTRLRHFRAISGEEWLRRVLTVPKKHRHHVAYIIWWDWFSIRECVDRWPHLDHFLYKTDRSEPSLPDLIKGLITCGYTEAEATLRIDKKPNH